MKPINDSALHAIILDSQIVFVTDTLQQIPKMYDAILNYYSRKISLVELNQTIYQFAHSLKGIALTIDFENIHTIAVRLTCTIKDSANHADATILSQDIRRIEVMLLSFRN